MSNNDEIEQKIARLCSYVCNGKTYNYEQRLYLATKHGLYDAAIIYAWNIFMLFVYEKVWQLREVEKEAGTPNKTDKVFLDALNSNKPIDYFDGHLCSLGKIQTECKQGEDFIVGKLKDIYKNVDQQYFKKAQGVLQKRNEKAHINSLGTEKEDLEQVLRELIQVCSAIQTEHNGFVTKIFELLEKKSEWHISDEDMRQINAVFSASGNTVHKFKYVHVANLIVKQEFSPETVKDIKDRAIQYFLESKGFRTSEENTQLLINPLTAILNQDDIRKILTGSFDNDSHGYNQILQASGIEDIFIELHSLSQNNFPELEQDWVEFVIKIKAQGYQDNFKNLILEIESPSVVENTTE
jgi:cold shock CspA family protein